jgi:SAM-dependent methyltransferase
LDPREYEIMFHAEEHHWWYRGMEAITRALLDRWVPAGMPLRILDAGCGTGGAMSGFLARYGEVTGVDIFPAALTYCHRRNAERIACASVLELPLDSDSFDLVTSFDVLYERAVADEGRALGEFFRVLLPGGRLLLRLPAYNWLRGQHDRQVHTNRRYTREMVKELLEKSNFAIEHITYANTILFPLALIKRLGERIFPPRQARSDLTLNTTAYNRAFTRILASEAFLASRVGLPFGLSVFAIARK